MKPPPFDYVAPTTVGEALRLLADAEREVKVIAGGQSLLPVLNMRLAHPDVLLDIRRIPELDRVVTDEQGRLVVGARVTQAAAHSAQALRAGWPLLAAAIGHIGHPQIRNRGTVCGSLAHHDPAAELPATAVALDAVVRIASRRGTRTVPANELFLAPFMTTLEPDELLTEVVFPPLPAGSGWAFREFARRRGDFATAGVAVLLERAKGRIGSVRIVCFGVGPVPVRAGQVEQALLGDEPSKTAIEQATAKLTDDVHPTDDVHASATFRGEITARLLGTAIREAWERAA